MAYSTRHVITIAIINENVRLSAIFFERRRFHIYHAPVKMLSFSFSLSLPFSFSFSLFLCMQLFRYGAIMHHHKGLSLRSRPLRFYSSTNNRFAKFFYESPYRRLRAKLINRYPEQFTRREILHKFEPYAKNTFKNHIIDKL